MKTNLKTKKKRIITNYNYSKSKKNHSSRSVRDLLNGALINLMLKIFFKYETGKFIISKEFKMKDGFIKIAFQILNYKYNNITNDIFTKQFNNSKTFFTSNSFMHEMYQKTVKASPIIKVRQILKKIKGIFAKIKDFFNLTGFSVTHKTVLLSSNSDDDYAYDLKTFNKTRRNLRYKIIKDLRKYRNKIFKKFYIKSGYKKHYFKVNFFGYKIKIRNFAHQVKQKMYKFFGKKKPSTLYFYERIICYYKLLTTFKTFNPS